MRTPISMRPTIVRFVGCLYFRGSGLAFGLLVSSSGYCRCSWAPEPNQSLVRHEIAAEIAKRKRTASDFQANVDQIKARVEKLGKRKQDVK
jgi:hypothetical protein